MPVIHNVFTRVTYLKDGEQRTKWYRVGILKITGNGGKYLRLFHQPETTFYVVEKETVPEDMPAGQAGNFTGIA